jgi:hypothetical protein
MRMPVAPSMLKNRTCSDELATIDIPWADEGISL